MQRHFVGLLLSMLTGSSALADKVVPLEIREAKRAVIAQRLEKLSKSLDDATSEREKAQHLSDISILLQDKKLRITALPPRIRKLLEDKSPAIRRNAVGILGRLEDEGSSEKIKKLTTSDPDPRVRRISIDALAMCSKRDSIPHLKKLLHEPDVYMRVQSAAALGYLGDESGYTVAIAEIKNQNQKIRELSAIAIGRIGRVDSLETLKRALENKEIKGASAYQALLAIELKSIGSEKGKIEFLRTLLEDKNKNRQESAAWVLGSMEDTPEASATLIKIAQSSAHPGHETAYRVSTRLGLMYE